MDLKFIVRIGIITATLHGCGGGTESASKPTTEPVTSNTNAIVVNDTDIMTDQSVELILHQPSKTISNIQWQQTSGSSINLIASTSKVLAFTPYDSGEYSFEVTYLVDGEQQQASKTITVKQGNPNIIARLGHTVAEGNKVSLRASITNELSASSTTWQQSSGPLINLEDANGQLAVFFDAPEVSQDSIIELTVSSEDSNGNRYSDTVSLLVEAKSAIASNAYFDERVADVFPYIKTSSHSQNLVPCVYSNTLSSSCTLEKLPLIAQETDAPTVDDIMARVVVSHQWMGDRFRQFLTQYDQHNDFKNLLRATTAIVISYDIRPAFYWAATGAIYLDPDDLWLTVQERDTINQAPDYRAAFGSDLQFEMIWRFVKNNDYASNYIPINVRLDRSLDDIQLNLSYLLYHELAHANDVFPSEQWSSHSLNQRVLDAALRNSPQSDLLSIAYPLDSQLLRDIAQVRYGGKAATTSQKALLPSDIQQHFDPEGAVYLYGFFTTREDYAMLFDELMMQARFGVSRDIAITNRPAPDASGRDYIVQWGQRGRIASAQISDRALFASERILPEFDAVSAINLLPQVQALPSGKNWVESIVITSPQPFSLARQLLQKSAYLDARPVRNTLGHYQKPLPKH